MTTTSENAGMTAQSVVVLRPRAARLTATIDSSSPRSGADARGGTVRALTAALAPHLSTADPELHGLAATLLTAQQGYTTSAFSAPDVDRDEARRRYFSAAQDYCAALDHRGFPAPPGLLEAVRWLADQAVVGPAGRRRRRGEDSQT